MNNPLSSLLAQTKIGFTMQYKVLFTLGACAYGLSCVDLVPDVFFPFGFTDDAFALYLLIRVWASPTLTAVKTVAPAAPATKPAEINPPVIVADVVATPIETTRVQS